MVDEAEVLEMAREVLAGKTRSYVSAAKVFAEYLLAQHKTELDFRESLLAAMETSRLAMAEIEKAHEMRAAGHLDGVVVRTPDVAPTAPFVEENVEWFIDEEGGGEQGPFATYDEAIGNFRQHKGDRLVTRPKSRPEVRVRVNNNGPSHGREGVITDTSPDREHVKVQLDGDNAGSWWDAEVLVYLTPL